MSAPTPSQWQATCPNTARLVHERFHGNIAFCIFCNEHNPGFDAEAAARVAHASLSTATGSTSSPAPSADPPISTQTMENPGIL
jgi:hypothetical protein